MTNQQIYAKVLQLNRVNDMVLPVFEKLVEQGKAIYLLQNDLMREFGGCPFATTESSRKVEHAIGLLVESGIAQSGSHYAVRDYNKGFMPYVVYERFNWK